MPDRQYIFVSDLVWMLYPLYLAACLAAPATPEDDRIMYAITSIRFRYKILVGVVWLCFASTLPLWLAKIVLFKGCWTTFAIVMLWIVTIAAPVARHRIVTAAHRRYVAKSVWVMIALCLVATWLDLT